MEELDEDQIMRMGRGEVKSGEGGPIGGLQK